MGKLLWWVKQPMNLAISTLLFFIVIVYSVYIHKTKRLAELEYKESVQKKQQEVIAKYSEVDREIRKRAEDTVKWNENIVKDIEKEMQDNDKAKPYSITATDTNSSL